MRHLTFSALSFQYSLQSFVQPYIFLYSTPRGNSIFFASQLRLGRVFPSDSISFNNSCNCVKLLSIQAFINHCLQIEQFQYHRQSGVQFTPWIQELFISTATSVVHMCLMERVLPNITNRVPYMITHMTNFPYFLSSRLTQGVFNTLLCHVHVI